MYCRNCGELIDKKAEMCVKCGCNPQIGDKYCPKCGAETTEKQAVCTICGHGLNWKNFLDSFDIDIDFSTPIHEKMLSPYYQNEFEKIYNSKEAYNLKTV